MAIKLIIGGSGSGKSTYVYKKIIDEATSNPKKRYFIIVPDQFTMQTQQDMVRMSPNGGILNIEVLSFSRLAHRVFEETGGGKKLVLDDTGKNLVLRKCAVDVKDEIPYLSGKLDKAGYIHEVKSAISEFMQYGISPDSLTELIDFSNAAGRKTLTHKLGDLSVIYRHFLEYINEKFITTEESMDILTNEVYKSRILRESVIVFDGFTGFTPIQNRVLGALMEVCSLMVMTFTMDKPSKAGEDSIQELFTFTQKSYNSILKIAAERGIEVMPTEVVSNQAMPADAMPADAMPTDAMPAKVGASAELEIGIRYKNSPELGFLERRLFRYPAGVYKGECKNIKLSACLNVHDEVELLVKNIRHLVKDEGAQYRDIAVISGNLAAYSSEIVARCEEYDIPVYLDETRKITMNPFVEYIKSALLMINRDFDYDSVFQYLRTGFTSIASEEVDILEKYVRETGIRGRSAYSRVFSRKTREMKRLTEEYKKALVAQDSTQIRDEGFEKLKQLESIRLKMMEELNTLIEAGISKSGKLETKAFVKSIYNFIEANHSYDRLVSMSAGFTESGDFARSKEYDQIYERTCELLEQIYELIGDEFMSLADFYGILEAGFSEIKVGMIPQSVDRVIVGDMERTRLKPVRYLFFIGLNDGWVPKSGGGGGIISDYDREFLVTSGKELAPSPRQQMYIGRFYLYSNLTKPSEKLYLSYLAMDNEGASVRPSVVLKTINSMFPGLEQVEYDPSASEISTKAELKQKYANFARNYAENTLSADEIAELYKISAVLYDEKDYILQVICNAFYLFSEKKLDKRIAAILYGVKLHGSISRVETFAKCAYAYFLKYGLGLEERQEYGIEAKDMGNIYHGVLEIFIRLLQERGLDWSSFTDEEAKELIDIAVEEEAVNFTDAILFESESNKYVLERMKSVMLRTVSTLAYQLRKSSFKPFSYEYKFHREQSLGRVNLALNEEEKLYLTGSIDRLDISEQDGKILVKIVDYKSGKKDFSLMSFYHGVQLQMVVYMKEATENLKKKYPDRDVIPAAMLYYHIDDPMVDAKDGDSIEKIEAEIKKALKTKGLVGDEDQIIASLDNTGEANSDVIPVGRKKDGSFDKYSQVISRENMGLLTDYASHKLLELSRDMFDGEISANPIEIMKDKSVEMNSCQFCEFKNVCGFKEGLPGCRVERFDKIEDEEIFKKMRAELGRSSVI